YAAARDLALLPHMQPIIFPWHSSGSFCSAEDGSMCSGSVSCGQPSFRCPRSMLACTIRLTYSVDLPWVYWSDWQQAICSNVLYQAFLKLNKHNEFNLIDFNFIRTCICKWDSGIFR